VAQGDYCSKTGLIPDEKPMKRSRRLAVMMVCVAVWASRFAQAQFGGTTNINNARPAGIIVTNGPGSFTLSGGGESLWWEEDQFFFAHHEVTNDFDIRVRVASVSIASSVRNGIFSTGGLMVRESWWCHGVILIFDN